MAYSAHRRPPPPESPLPEDWIARFRAGDESAFERLFREYYDPLCRHVAGCLGNQPVAFKNANDGSKVLLAVNTAATSQTLAVLWAGTWFRYTLDAGAVATFVWS